MVWALIAYSCVSLFSLAMRTADAVMARDGIREQIAMAEAENERLRYAVEHMDDPEIVRNIAETKLGLVSVEK